MSEAPPELRPRRAVRLLEVVAVALLGTATLGSAWCGYQASRWNSNERDLAREAAGFQLEAGRLYGLATQTLVYDGIVISDYAAAVSAGDEELQQFYDEALVRPGLRPVIERWREDAASGQGAPTSLIEDEAYRQEQLAPYDAAVARGAEAMEASETASRHADDYVLVALLLASALFLVGVMTSFRLRFAQLLLLGIGAAAILGASIRLIGLPSA